MLGAPHLRLTASDVVPHVVTCGDPARAERIAKTFSSARCLQQNREYHSWIGEANGRPIMAVSHGVGASGAAICWNELANLGVETIIRVGTAGALSDDVAIADLVVATAAVRLDGVTQLMVPPEFPAVPDAKLTERLAERCPAGKTKRGIVVSTALFYASVLPDALEVYRKAGALAVEMEASALFVLGSLRGLSTASVFVIDGNPAKWEQGQYAPKSNAVHDALGEAIAAAVAACTAA